MNLRNNHHEIVLLSEHENGTISKCRCCNMYTLSYKTMMIPFSKKAFYKFEHVLKQFCADDYNMYHPHGMKALIRNNHSDLGIALTFLEVQELLSMYEEVHVMEEVFGVLD